MRRAIVWTAAVLLCAATAHAAEPPKIAAIGDLPLERGGTIRDCRLEYRTLGTLNADRTNAVLFPTWFSGRTENLTGLIFVDFHSWREAYRRLAYSSSRTNIVPKFDPAAFITNELPVISDSCVIPGTLRAISPMRYITSRVRSVEAESGNWTPISK